MNVYIALLGNTYDEISGNIEARFTQYRLNCIKTLLLRSQFNRIVTGSLSAPDRELLMQREDREELQTTAPCWIKMPSTADKDPEDPAVATKEQVKALQEKLDE